MLQALSLSSQKSPRRPRIGPAPRQRRTSSHPTALAVCAVALTDFAVALTAVAAAVVDEVPSVVAVEFAAVVEGLPVDLVLLLDQCRRPSPPHGTRL
jgi:hypothetical protein